MGTVESDLPKPQRCDLVLVLPDHAFVTIANLGTDSRSELTAAVKIGKASLKVAQSAACPLEPAQVGARHPCLL
jgi:hypothetical protein